MKTIKIAIAGLGNCASSLIQGIHYYKTIPESGITGLMHNKIGGYGPGDIQVVAAFDIDRRKVGLDVNRAIFSHPNCTRVFCPPLRDSGIEVKMGRILDGVADHMMEYPEERRFVRANEQQPYENEVIRHLRDSGADILLSYMPVGAREATQFYAQCALEAGTGFYQQHSGVYRFRRKMGGTVQRKRACAHGR